MFRNIAITPAFNFSLNLVTDFGAPIDGLTDTSPAWLSFTGFLAARAVAGNTVKLTVPNHTYLFDRGHVSGISMLPGIIGGIYVIVDAPTGAIFTTGADPNASGYFLASQGAILDFSGASYINQANIGDTSVTLVTQAEISNFQVNQWVMINGIDLQGFGNPPNPAFFEYRKITSINTGAGIIRFSGPLANQYLTTWPIYNTLLKGPASVCPMPSTWDITGTYNNITFQQPSETIYNGRVGIFNNCVMTNAGVIPTVNQNITFNNCNGSAVSLLEIDKCIETLTYNGGTYKQIAFQSQGAGTNTTLNGITFTDLNGTPGNITINNCTISGDLGLGCLDLGYTKSITLTNNTINGNVLTASLNISGLVGQGFSLSGGVFTISKASFGPVAWAIPGCKVFLGGSKLNEDSQFTVSAVADDGSGNTLITTNIPAGYPNIPGTLASITHPCLTFSGGGNSGASIDAASFNGAPAQGTYLFSYSNRTYTKTNLATSPLLQIWGQLVSININVTTPYTGTQPTLTAVFIDALTPDHTTISSYNPTINLKQSGVRTITPIAVASQAGDTGFTIPGNIWFTGQTNIVPNHDVSGENAGPVVSIEIITDQTISIFP